MTTINEIYSFDAEAMMTLSEIGFAAYERFKEETIAEEKGSMLRIKLKSWLSDRANMERELELRIKVAPKYKAVS